MWGLGDEFLLPWVGVGLRRTLHSRSHIFSVRFPSTLLYTRPLAGFGGAGVAVQSSCRRDFSGRYRHVQGPQV